MSNNQEPIQHIPESLYGERRIKWFRLMHHVSSGEEMVLAQLFDGISTRKLVNGLAIVAQKRGIKMKKVIINAPCHLLVLFVKLEMLTS